MKFFLLCVDCDSFGLEGCHECTQSRLVINEGHIFFQESPRHLVSHHQSTMKTSMKLIRKEVGNGGEHSYTVLGHHSMVYQVDLQPVISPVVCEEMIKHFEVYL